jgi:predicted outer membrane repeat protein
MRVEPLEDRTMPSTFTVTTPLDVVSATDGKLSLREAISAANAHAGADVVVVPVGTFKITIPGAVENLNATGDFDVTGDLTIKGAGAGATIIDAQQLDRVFDLLGNIGVTFSGVTLQHGNSGTFDGGAIQTLSANITLDHCVVKDNRAGLGGGGVNASGGNVTLIGTTVARNVAQNDGGGVRVDTGAMVVKGGSIVRRNVAGGNGGGISAHTGLTLTNSTVSDNVSSANGGGISAGTATLTNSTVSGNAVAGNGGGISATTATLTGSTVYDNSAGGNGGGISATTATLTNSTVAGNSALTSGGGIATGSGALLNCTVAENTAHTGGGVFHPTGTLTVRNTIIALNLTDFTGSGADVSGTFASGGHNLIGDGTGGTGFTNGTSGDIVGTSAVPIDPKLGPLANNGGRTKTMALLAGSPAIDHGDNAGLPSTDQRGVGFPRKKDGNGDGISVADIGAFER